MTGFLNHLITDSKLNFNITDESNSFYTVIEENGSLSDIHINAAVVMNLNEKNTILHVIMDSVYKKLDESDFNV